MKSTIKYIAIMASAAAATLFGCSPTKYFAEDDKLLTDMSVECDNKQIDVAEAEEYIRQKPVRSVFGFAIYSRIYNSVDPQKNEIRKAKIQKDLDEKNNNLRIKHEDKISSYKTRARD